MSEVDRNRIFPLIVSLGGWGGLLFDHRAMVVTVLTRVGGRRS